MMAVCFAATSRDKVPRCEYAAPHFCVAGDCPALFVPVRYGVQRRRNVLTRLRGLGQYLSLRVKEINLLT